MKVTIINHSDSKGGASVVSLRLMRALRAEGIDARMLVMHKGTDDRHVHAVDEKMMAKATFLAEHLDIYMHNGFSRARLFQASTAKFGLPLASHRLVKDADIVILGWVNQGMISLNEIEKIKAPVIWNMHDMWCMTGLCHHAGVCGRYSGECGCCHLLHDASKAGHMPDLSTRTQARKKRLYGNKRITFVPVSNWLAEKCKESSLLRSHPIKVIPNAFPAEQYYCEPKRPRSSLGLPDNKKLIVMGAARLDDPIKGLDTAIEALNQLSDMTDVAAVFFGDIRNAEILRTLNIPYAHIGSVSDHDLLRDIYAHCTAVLSASHYETLPGTLIEGMAAGCVPVTFGQGGQADIIDHLRTGYIAAYPSADDLAAGLKWAINAGIDRNEQHDEMRRRFSSQTVAREYISLFNKLLTP